MKIKIFLKKLFIPLYIFFLLSIIASSFLSGAFEHYSNMPFEELVQFVRDNSDKLQPFVNDINQEKDRGFHGEIRKSELQLENELKIKFGFEDDKSWDERLQEKYWIYSTRNPAFFMLLAIIIYLVPVYRFNFKGKNEPDDKTIKRVLNLPVFIFILPWAGGLWGLFLKLLVRDIDGIEITGKLTANLIASFLMYGSLAGFINSWYTTRYINNGIARQIFREYKLYSLKNGVTMNLTARILLMIISIGMIPLLLSIYIPAVFNSWMFKSLAAGEELDIVTVGQIFGPLLITTIVSLFFLTAQLFSIFSFRKNIQGPLNILIERMQDVAKGDFTTRSSVLSSDEIGKLKGHFNTMVEGLEEREKLRDTFGKFVSIEIAKKLIDTHEIDLAGEEIETTVMFADIRSFTTISEGYTPRELIEFLNDYFSYMVKPISLHQGVINKFIGDCIMAVFSPVFGLENHAEAAVKAALEMRKELDDFNAAAKYPPIRHGIGIHTGFLIAGNVGSEDRKEYTVIGDTVNLASRIESQTKVYETDILISESTYSQLDQKFIGSIKTLKNDPVIVRGKSKPITLYSIK